MGTKANSLIPHLDIVHSQIDNYLKDTKNNFENIIKEIQTMLKSDKINSKQDIIENIVLKLLLAADWDVSNPEIVTVDYENYEVKTYIRNKNELNNDYSYKYKILFKIVDKNILNNKDYYKLLDDIFMTTKEELRAKRPLFVIITDGIIFKFLRVFYDCIDIINKCTYLSFEDSCFLSINLFSPKIFQHKDDFLFFMFRENYYSDFSIDVAFYRHAYIYFKERLVKWDKNYTRKFILAAQFLNQNKKVVKLYIENGNKEEWFIKLYSTEYYRELPYFSAIRKIIKHDAERFPSFTELVAESFANGEIPENAFKWKISYYDEDEENI